MANDPKKLVIGKEKPKLDLSIEEIANEVKILGDQVTELEVGLGRADIAEQKALLFTPHIKKIYRFCVICSGVLLSLTVFHVSHLRWIK